MAASVVIPASIVRADDSADMKKLQDENAALRKRLAELEGQAAAQPAAATTQASAAAGTTTAAGAPALATDEGVTTLSPYQVTSEKDNGYLRTNSVTATRINMPIQNIPISVSVMSKDFIDDANIRSITDVLRYTSSGNGDNRFAMARPANSATPQGGFTLRGFGVNSLLRNGVSRYIGYNVNNVDRIEIVKGPASVFFGAGYPGGVINYITKQPVFAKIPTTLSYTFGENNTNRVLLDNNSYFSKKAAMRIVGSWENSSGERNFEFRKENSLTGNITFVPFDSGKVRITGEVETFDSLFNVNAWDWIYPSGWFQAYANPSQALINAAGLAGNADPVAAYRARIYQNIGNYGADMRTAAGDPGLPLYTQSINGAYYTDATGKRIHDKGFNYTNRSSYSKQHVDTTDVVVELSPFSWVDARYVLTAENGRFDNVEGYMTPNADGRTFSMMNGLNGSGYWRRAQNHQFDVIFKYDRWGIKQKLLVGGVFQKTFQQYNAPAAAPLTPDYSLIPGISNPEGNPNGQFGQAAGSSDVPVNQVVRDRYGNIKTVQQIFTQYDPGYEIEPTTNRLVARDRAAVDGYYSEQQSGYLNYNASMFDDRLTILAGVRREMNRDSGQYLTANFPWYSPPPYAFADQTTYPPSAYNYSPAYAGGYDNFTRQAGTSWMAGLSFEVVKDINVYATYSKTFRLNVGNAGGIGIKDVTDIYNGAMAYQQTQGKNSFTYGGKTIASVADLEAALAANGALTKLANETGSNAEIGVKTSLWDNKLVGTFAIFASERSNQKLDDGQRQASEELNYGNNWAIFGPPGNGTNTYTNSRVLRWRTVGVKNQIRGADFDFVWSPIRNFQGVLNGAWLWTAKTAEDPTRRKPGTADFNAASAATQEAWRIYFNNRLENVPEYRLNAQGKYTFTDSTLAGLSVGVGARYSSKAIISRSIDWNPDKGGLTAGNFLVFDLNVGYPWEMFGYKISTRLGVYNVTDEKYLEGTFVNSPRRSWLLTNTLSF